MWWSLNDSTISGLPHVWIGPGSQELVQFKVLSCVLALILSSVAVSVENGVRIRGRHCLEAEGLSRTSELPKAQIDSICSASRKEIPVIRLRSRPQRWAQGELVKRFSTGASCLLPYLKRLERNSPLSVLDTKRREQRKWLVEQTSFGVWHLSLCLQLYVLARDTRTDKLAILSKEYFKSQFCRLLQETSKQYFYS